MPQRDPDGFGLYIHWPYCQAKCPYCDFNSYVADHIDHKRWTSAYLIEIERLSQELPGRTLQSVFFGGGTPSLMAPDMVGEILAQVRKHWPAVNDLEVTLEANPTSIEAARFKAFRDAGVNRVSVGVQALNDEDLRRLGRLHSAEEAKDAVKVAQSVFDRTSFDLIYARQFQTIEAWRAELTEALAFSAGHLSLYQLTIEPNTAFGDRFARNRLPGLVPDDPAADMYDLTQEMCVAAGLPAYEISNHAADLDQSRHNLIYWRGGDYAGIGPGAHGRLTLQGTRWATSTEKSPLVWLKSVETAGSGELHREALSTQDHALEYVLMSMRLREGMDLRHFADISGLVFPETALVDLSDLGMVDVTDTHARATDAGRPILNAVVDRMVEGLDL